MRPMRPAWWRNSSPGLGQREPGPRPQGTGRLVGPPPWRKPFSLPSAGDGGRCWGGRRRRRFGGGGGGGGETPGWTGPWTAGSGPWRRGGLPNLGFSREARLRWAGGVLAAEDSGEKFGSNRGPDGSRGLRALPARPTDTSLQPQAVPAAGFANIGGLRLIPC